MKKAFVLVVISLVFCSCIKDGSPGPQGPRGPQGPAGEAGRNGYGTYINTYYITVYQEQWERVGVFGAEGYYCYADKTLGNLTSSVIDAGAILVYMIVNDANLGDLDNQLPYLLPFNGGTRIIRYDLRPGKYVLL